MDGFTATRLLRGDPRLLNFPIIAMTAHALVEERQRCLDAGMNDHVSKPIDPDNLFVTLLRWAKPRPNQAAKLQSAIPDTKASDEVTLPEISGIKVMEGVNRVAGNRKLYRDLLEQFAVKQAGAPDQVSAAIESGDLKLAERIAHTVKGVAGNLGIVEVQSVAQKLEKALRDGEEGLSAPLAEFANVMGTQIQALNKALGESASTPPKAVQTSPFDGKAATAAIDRLRILLEASDGGAEESFRSLKDAVAGVVEKPYLDGLSASISDFDFDAALLKLHDIAEHCARNEGGK
jgi:CheY-like chemotaxis protein